MHKYIIYALLSVPPLLFFTDLTRNPYYFQIVFLQALIVFIFILFLFKGLGARKITLKSSNIDLPLLIFFLVATISWLVNLSAVWQDIYLRHASYSEGLKRWLFLLVNSILVYYIPLNFVDQGAREKFYKTIFFVGFIAAFYGILQFLGIELIWPRLLNPFGGRSVSTFGNPNFLSSYLVILLPLVFSYYLTATKPFSTALYFVYFLTYTISLVVTLTRSSWLGAAVAMLIFTALCGKFAFKDKKKRIISLAAACAIVLIFWPHPKSAQKYTPAIFERITETMDFTEGVYGAVHQRQLIWSCAWNMVQDFPVIGRGWGLFELHYPYYQGRHLTNELFRTLRTRANNAHNEVLEIWSQTGTIGFGIYIWFLVVVFVTGMKIYTHSGGFNKIVVAALIAGISGMLVDNLLNVSLHFAVPTFLYWWVLGSIMSYGELRTNEIQINRWWKKIIVVLLILCGGVLIRRYYSNFLGEINYFSGFKHSKRGELPMSLPYLEKAHRFQRFEVNNNYELGNTYARLNRHKEALWAYREALKANTSYDEIFFNMATVYMQMGDLENAEKNYSEALSINPMSFDSYSALGSLYMSDLEKNSQKALILFKRAHEFFPDNRDIVNNLGYLYTRTNQPERAIEFYKKAIEIDPEFLMARKNLETLLRQQGVTDSFLTEYDMLMDQLEKLIEKQNWESAINVSKKIAEKYPRSFRARFYLANLYLTVGNFGNAEKLYKELIQLQPNNTTLLSNLAAMYEKQGRVQDARSVWERIKQLEPTNRTALERLK